jgi:hypothetical protein
MEAAGDMAENAKEGMMNLMKGDLTDVKAGKTSGPFSSQTFTHSHHD